MNIYSEYGIFRRSQDGSKDDEGPRSSSRSPSFSCSTIAPTSGPASPSLTFISAAVSVTSGNIPDNCQEEEAPGSIYMLEVPQSLITFGPDVQREFGASQP